MEVFDRLSLGLRRRLPMVLQTETAECGLACIAMIAGYHDHRIDLASLRRRFPVSVKGATLKSMVDVANRIGLSSRAVRLELENLRQLQSPCVLHWKMDHFVVLKSVGSRSIRIHDPSGGERKVSIGEASDAFTGIALELWPNKEFKRTDERRTVRLRDLIGHVTGIYRSLGEILLLAFVIEVFSIISPLFMQWVIDHALVSGNRDLLTTLAVGFGLLVILQQSVTTLRSWVVMHFGTTLNVRWRANVFAHLFRLPISYFEKRHLGDIISRFRSIDIIQRTVTATFIEAIVDGLMTIAILALLFLYSAVLSWICVSAIALYAIGRWIWYEPMRMAAHEQIIHTANQESYFLETIRGARTIKLFQRQDERRLGWLTLVVDQVNAGLRGQKLQIFYKLLNGLLFGVENIVVVWVGAHLVLDKVFTVGMLMAFMSYKGQFSSRVSGLIDKFIEVKMLQIQGERLADIVMTEPEGTDAAVRVAMSEEEQIKSTMEIRALRFKYAEHEPYVLDGVDLRIEAGESVAIVGPSGCGKTTLLHIMLGILQPTDGEVLVGGVSLRHVGVGAVRQAIASVTQDDTLFAGSISENISFFDSQPDQALVEECARAASIHAEILAMPMAYNTSVGYMGSVLSGGQKQRVLLARAMYKRPAILILDEATSHLDIKREIMVNAGIRALNITRIIVAHRPQTTETTDRILTLENGKITKEMRISPNISALRGSSLAQAIPSTSAR